MPDFLVLGYDNLSKANNINDLYQERLRLKFSLSSHSPLEPEFSQNTLQE